MLRIPTACAPFRAISITQRDRATSLTGLLDLALSLSPHSIPNMDAG